jgi:hypothetical protein
MPRRLSVAGAVLGLLVVLLVAGVAAREGGYTARLPPGATTTDTAAPTRPADLPTAAPSTTAAEQQQPDLPRSQALGRVVLVILVLALLAGGTALVFSLVRSARDLARSGALTPPRAVGTAVREALAPAAEQALAAVEQPDAREAVVRSWLLLGAAAAEAGVPARPAETATEYARRIASEFYVGTAALARLAELYREARFSGHPVRGPQRAEARDLLERLSTELGHGRR